VQQHEAPARAQTRKRRLELQRLVHALLDELFDRGLTSRAERAWPEAAAKAFDAGEAET
jgi:hypothetical protein